MHYVVTSDFGDHRRGDHLAEHPGAEHDGHVVAVADPEPEVVELPKE